MKIQIRLAFEKHDLDLIERNLHYYITHSLAMPIESGVLLLQFAEIHSAIALFEKIRKRNSPVFASPRKTRISFNPAEASLLLEFINENDPYQFALKTRLESLIHQQLLGISDQLKMFYQSR